MSAALTKRLALGLKIAISRPEQLPPSEKGNAFPRLTTR
jgi:hypothetical protein